jgi:glycosyltransferase involved in cell wall biosynthesis
MVVLVDDGPSSAVKGPIDLVEDRDGDVHLVHMRYRPWAVRVAGVLGALTAARRLSRAGTPVDLLHAHVHRMAWVAMQAGVVLRRPYLVSEHSSEWTRRLMTAGRLRRAKISLRRASVVCPVNVRLQQAIESYGVRARFRVVPNTVDTDVFHPASVSPRDGPTRLINVAHHVEVKALDMLLRAFAAVAGQPTLELIGEGPLTPTLKELAAELGVGERVDFRGLAEPAEIADRLRASDIFVLSSLSENMPLAVLEALCCGLPVAATDVGGVPEAVGEDGVLAPSGDAEALAGAVEQVASRLERYDRADIAGRAAERWSFAAVGGTWDEIYRWVALR